MKHVRFGARVLIYSSNARGGYGSQRPELGKLKDSAACTLRDTCFRNAFIAATSGTHEQIADAHVACADEMLCLVPAFSRPESTILSYSPILGTAATNTPSTARCSESARCLHGSAPSAHAAFTRCSLCSPLSCV